MVEDWGVADPNEVGKYSGFVIASYMFGQMLFSYPVGMAADVIGRKPALLIGLLGSCIFTFLFGFSSSFYEALVYRIICGSLNGIVSITKTTLSEITDSSNQGLAFSILGLARAVGLVVGPSYPGIFPPGSLFDRYAYALPCIVGAAVSGTGFLASIFVLEETKKFPPGEDGSLQSVTTALGHTVGDACRDAAAHVHRLATAAFAVVRAAGLSSWQPRHDRATPIDLENDPVNCADGAGEDEPLLGRQRAASPAAEDTHGQLSDDATSVTVSLGRKGPMTAWELLNDRKIFLSILLYAFISALYIQYDEIFSLWSRMPREQGGLAFTTSDIGIVFSVGGVSLFFYQLFLYAPIERRLGPLGTFKWGILFSLPAFTSSFILTANSCPAHSRGSANGLTQSFGAFSRMVGPIFAGNLFSWSVESGLPCPFDYHLIYYILALATLGIYAVSRIVPRDADVRVEEVLDPLTDDEDDEEN
ncbi:hypothetical protein HK405_002557 [Cladochytrium tenue]|nr:hypothetical protein HK405_002557 [Cladochytrium tenue]